MGSEAVLIWGMIFGSLGLGYFIYGKKQRTIIPFLVGIALFFLPYITTDVYLLVGLGIALVATPYFTRL